MSAPTLHQVLRDILNNDLEPWEMRSKLNDWLNDQEDNRERLLEHARAVKMGKPLKNHVQSAEAMADLAIRLL
jgi:hypothetical protein